MKLSIITFLDLKNIKNITKFLKSFDLQKENNFELILIVDSFNPQFLESISKFENRFDNPNIKIIFNYKKQGLMNGIIDSVNIATKEYIFISFNLESIDSFFVNKTNELLNTTEKVDIIEFRPNLKEVINWNPQLRYRIDGIHNIEEKHEILAYTYPFIFNKIFCTKIFKDALKSKTFRNSTSIFNIELFYTIFAFAKTFRIYNHNLLKEEIHLPLYSNIFSFFKDWKSIEEFYRMNRPELLSELIYAKFFDLQVLIPGVLGLINKKNLFKENSKQKQNEKYFEKLKSIYDLEFKNLAISSKYMISDNVEVPLLEKITPISKWNKILKYFE